MEFLEAFTNIGFDWRVALANLVNFLIVFWLLKRFLFAPLSKVLSERKQKIDEGLERAQAADTELVVAREQAKSLVEEARLESNSIISEAREKERSIMSEAKINAERQSEKILEDAQKAIGERQQAMEREVLEKTADVVIASVEKILKEEVDRQKSEEIIKRTLQSA